MLSLKNLSFAWPGQPSLFSNLVAEVPAGHVLGIVGRNGAGKSTLLRLLNGLLRPETGDVLVRDKSTRNMQVHEIARYVGTLYQTPEQQLFAARVRDELAFGPQQLKLSPTEIERRVEQALIRTHLTYCADRHPLDLSAAERRFTALASLLSMEPEIILLDEPQRGLDHIWRERLQSIIRDESSSGKVVVLICHDMDFVDNNVHSVLSLGGGETPIHPTDAFFNDSEVVRRAHVEPPARLRLARLAQGISGRV
ncbi:MAG: ABC transporter ATP-binding protein [Comamonas sp.]